MLNLPLLRDTIFHPRDTYLAAPAFTRDYAWKDDGGGARTLCDLRGDPLPLSVVGSVQALTLKCTPIGDFVAGYDEALSAANYRFVLEEPLEDAFLDDFRLASTRLSDMQSPFQATSRGMISMGTIVFQAPVFTPRREPPPQTVAVYLEDPAVSVEVYGSVTTTPPADIDAEPDGTDTLTLQWPVHPMFRSQLQSVQTTHRVSPLPVLYNGELVDPVEIQTTLASALVDVHFTLSHRPTGRGGHTFTATATTLHVLRKCTQPPPRRSTSQRQSAQEAAIRLFRNHSVATTDGPQKRIRPSRR
ncbi:hypothetical protein PLICRDRAFT_176848 [Plicaturopsis crispa FD-325 SS-3]|nr:hypothetical protein PLICRDRAFT_176848 [Plicaturopsis crispa FD-325 SS-3]